ncbi:MAG: hypothetical protein ACI4FY_09375 [Acetatifactor sp.]
MVRWEKNFSGSKMLPRNQREYHDWMGEIVLLEEKSSPETRGNTLVGWEKSFSGSKMLPRNQRKYHG